MNTNFEVIGLTRLGIEAKSTVPEVDALTTRLSALLPYIVLGAVSWSSIVLYACCSTSRYKSSKMLPWMLQIVTKLKVKSLKYHKTPVRVELK